MRGIRERATPYQGPIRPALHCGALANWLVRAGAGPDLFAALALVHAQCATRSYIKQFMYKARFGGTPATPNVWRSTRREVQHGWSSPYGQFDGKDRFSGTIGLVRDPYPPRFPSPKLFAPPPQGLAFRVPRGGLLCGQIVDRAD